ncbi:MAG: DegT/DnrJ/EryC1/StrS family aminotransferase [archaeon]
MKKIHVGDFRLGDAERSAILEVVESGRISEGRKVREFEKQWSGFVGTDHCVVLSSGTSAILAGLMALKNIHDLRNRPKVITTPITYIATSNAVVAANLDPVYVDVNRETFNITPENIKEALENSDDASEHSVVLPVHLMGYPCDMDGINRIAKEHDMVVFEDSAQAHGSLYKGKRTGSLSHLSDFSFYIAHNIQVGEMGAITTNDKEISRLVRKIKANGRMCDCNVCTRATGKCPHMDSDKGHDFDPRFHHDIIGLNFKTTEFQAALGLTQIKKAEWIIKARQENVRLLNEGLEEFSDILQLPRFSTDISYLAYPILINKPNVIPRKRLRMQLEENGVETRPLFGSIPTQQPAYAHLRETYRNRLPNADYIGENAFYIGCHQYLEADDIDYIVGVFKKILK